jgi:transcriptional regulator of acetoin/glycerol metabolism
MTYPQVPTKFLERLFSLETPVAERLDQIRPLCEVEKEAILKAIKMTRSCATAANALGIGKTTIYRKLREYGFQHPADELLPPVEI